MLTFHLPRAVAPFMLAIAQTTICLSAPLPTPAAPSAAGAVFSTATLNALLGEGDCVGIRFYNAVLDRSQSQTTFMAIAYRSDGSDINEGVFAHPYMACAPVEREPANINALSRNAAADACGNVTTTGAASYSTTISKQDLQVLLAQPGCGGVRVLLADGTTDRLLLVAVSIADGVATDLGRGGDYERSCGDPCPMLCGPPANYINANLLQLK